jgi:hypothetical protein
MSRISLSAQVLCSHAHKKESAKSKFYIRTRLAVLDTTTLLLQVRHGVLPRDLQAGNLMALVLMQSCSSISPFRAGAHHGGLGNRLNGTAIINDITEPGIWPPLPQEPYPGPAPLLDVSCVAIVRYDDTPGLYAPKIRCKMQPIPSEPYPDDLTLCHPSYRRCTHPQVWLGMTQSSCLLCLWSPILDLQGLPKSRRLLTNVLKMPPLYPQSLTLRMFWRG